MDGQQGERVTVKSCACGWPRLRASEVMGTIPDLMDCPDCGAPLKTTTIPAGLIQPRKVFHIPESENPNA